MALVDYRSEQAAAFRIGRHMPYDGLADWRQRIGHHLAPEPGTRLLDLGAGTGMWARAFTDWYDAEVVAVEPAEAMRALAAYPKMLAGHAAAIPLADAVVDAAWLSTVIHHVPDLTAAARELRRVVRPGGPVLIRSTFAGRSAGLSMVRFWPESLRVLDSYPSVPEVVDTFGAAGFDQVSLEEIPQLTADSLTVAAAGLRREAHTPLQLITDSEYAAGVARLHAAAEVETGPVIDSMDLLVLR